ncbi:MAG: DNA adenine methylase, partial [Actinomycetota bacterium]|nr:DNA adenine methylase [Actinomycetota bacterium]
MKPPFSYFGGKSGMARAIAGVLPPHRVYLEPFAGSLAVLFAKRPSAHEVVNDVDQALVTFFRVLRGRPAELAEVCRLTPYARAEYEAADLTSDPSVDDLELARRFWVRVNQSFAKTTATTTGFSMTIARNQAPSTTVQNRIGRFLACAERLANVTVECRPAIEIIERLGSRPETVIYADPPYLGSVRSRGRLSAVDYRHDMASDQAHIELAAALRSSPATVVISGYPSDLYSELYGDWWSWDFRVVAHSSNARRSARTGRTERIWCNHDLGAGRLPLGGRSASGCERLTMEEDRAEITPLAQARQRIDASGRRARGQTDRPASGDPSPAGKGERGGCLVVTRHPPGAHAASAAAPTVSTMTLAASASRFH